MPCQQLLNPKDPRMRVFLFVCLLLNIIVELQQHQVPLISFSLQTSVWTGGLWWPLALAYLPPKPQILCFWLQTSGRGCCRFLDSLGWQCESWLCYIPGHVTYFRESQAPILPPPLPKWLVLSIWGTRVKPQGKGTSLDVVFRNGNYFFLSPVLL